MGIWHNVTLGPTLHTFIYIFQSADGHRVQTRASAPGCIKADLKTFTFGARWHPLVTFLQYESTTEVSTLLPTLRDAESRWVCINSAILLWVWWEFQPMIYQRFATQMSLQPIHRWHNMSAFPNAILSPEVRWRQVSKSHWSPPRLQTSDILIPVSLWCATDRPGQFFCALPHSQSAPTSCSYAENQHLFATSHVKYHSKTRIGNDGNMKMLNARPLLALVFHVWWTSRNSRTEEAVISMLATSNTHPSLLTGWSCYSLRGSNRLHSSSV